MGLSTTGPTPTPINYATESPTKYIRIEFIIRDSNDNDINGVSQLTILNESDLIVNKFSTNIVILNINNNNNNNVYNLRIKLHNEFNDIKITRYF